MIHSVTNFNLVCCDNMEKKQLIVIAVVVIVVIAAVCIGVAAMNQNHDDKKGDKTVTDSRDRQVTVPGDIEKILCINSCSLELVSWFDSVDKVCALDSNDAIIGNKTYTQIFKDKFSKLQTITVSNTEEIIKLEPDLVISSTVNVADLDELQKTLEIPVYAINADLEINDDKWYDQITKLGTLFDESDRAKEIVDGVKKFIGEIKAESVTNVKGYACGMMFYGAGNFLKTTGDYLPFTYTGVENVMPTNSSGNKQPYNTEIEKVLATNFDYIFIDGSSAETSTNQIKEYIETTTLADEPAIVNGDVYKVMVYKVWGTQWDNLLINCFYVADTVNGEEYDWNFNDKANEVLKLFYGDNALSYSTIAAGESSGGCGQVTL